MLCLRPAGMCMACVSSYIDSLPGMISLVVGRVSESVSSRSVSTTSSAASSLPMPSTVVCRTTQMQHIMGMCVLHSNELRAWTLAECCRMCSSKWSCLRCSPSLSPSSCPAAAGWPSPGWRAHSWDDCKRLSQYAIIPSPYSATFSFAMRSMAWW